MYGRNSVFALFVGRSLTWLVFAQNFERKSALFSLAISEVLIINMWANDVGRYSAANYDTLRTVFEINLKLFHTAQYVGWRSRFPLS